MFFNYHKIFLVNILLNKMNTKNLYANINLNPKNTISFSDSFTTDHSDTHFRNNKKCLTQFSSPLVIYHNMSNKYLFRKFSENNKNMIDLENSNNFIRKDLLLEQRNNFSNSENEYNEENESEENLESSNNIYNKKNIINNIIDIDEYKQLKSNSNYYQTHQEHYTPNKQNTLKNNISYSPTNIININYNNNKKEIILNQTPNQIMNLNIINQFNLVNNNFQRSRFNSSNIIEGNVIFPIFSNNNNNSINKKEINSEMFGRKGWICSFCNNFNFESRNKCNKCNKSKQNKTPIKHKKKSNNNDNNIHKNNNNENKTQKQFSEREGDWICFNCKNVNFAFRKLCNRCQLSKNESENLFKINFQMFNSNIVGNNN